MNERVDGGRYFSENLGIAFFYFCFYFSFSFLFGRVVWVMDGKYIYSVLA